MALSKARPMRNSRERSGPGSVKCSPTAQERHTVDSLLISKGLSLLCPIPLYDEAVPEGEGSTRIGRSAINISIKVELCI